MKSSERYKGGPRAEHLMRILIDGYNLLFQSGLGGRARGPGWIGNARGKLVEFLQKHMDDFWASSTMVVFDKSQGKETQHDVQTPRGLKIVFAIEHPEADDLIEELIQAHSAPKSLFVVSSDLRVRRRAQTRRAQSLDSESFLRMLEDGKFRSKPLHGDNGRAAAVDPDAVAPDAVDSDEEKTLSENEVQFWLREFGE